MNGTGATPATNTIKNACLVNDENKACSDKLDHAEIAKRFASKCHGNSSCSFDFQTDTSLFVGTTVDPVCFHPNTQMFIQYTCEMNDGQKFDKYNNVAICTFSVMLISIMFVLVIYYAQNTSEINTMVYDVQTVTASDYTVEMDITKSMYDDFLKN